MNVRRWLWVACWCAGVAGVAAQQPFRVMCYNVENLWLTRNSCPEGNAGGHASVIGAS